MIRTVINGTVFEYIQPFKWAYVNRKVVKLPDSTRKAGVKITYADGVKRFIPNDWYTKEMIEML